METIILASGSKQRLDYFRLLGLPFRVIPSMLDEAAETAETGVCGRQTVEQLALRKAQKVSDSISEKTWIAGADTMIFLDGKSFGKPESRQNAFEMLTALQGRTHEVITAIALINEAKNIRDYCSVASKVTFAKMEKNELEWYLDTGEWEGAAGSYKIQGKASCFISRIDGSYSSIVGLPLHEFYVMLKNNGYYI